MRVVGSRKRIYNAEFREGAVRIVTETGKPIPEVAEELGVYPATLHSWVSRAKRNGSPSSDTPVQASAGAGLGGRLREGERAELERLRAEAREKDKRIRVAVRVISSCKAEQKIPHRIGCRALGVSESWFYKWRDREPTAREVRRQHLAEEIEEIFQRSGGTYGSPKVFLELVRRGWRVSVNTVAKVMAELELAGRKIRRRRSLTRPGKRPAAADFVRRDFTAEEPDLVWCGDLTEIETAEGKLYLATVIDLFSRRLLGYAMAGRHDADLVVASLNMAEATRGGDVRGVIMHTDRGSEY